MTDFCSPPFSSAGETEEARTAPARRGRGQKAPLTSEAAVYDCAVAALGRSAKTVAQLQRQLRRRVEPGAAGEALIAAALGRLQQQGYLSDARFAQGYAGTRMTQARLGRRRVAQELLQRGVAAELVEQEVTAAFAETDELTQARAFLAKKRVRPPTDQRDAARIFRLLARAGFGAGTATQALRLLRAGSATGPGSPEVVAEPLDQAADQAPDYE
jgi:regulatory protein